MLHNGRKAREACRYLEGHLYCTRCSTGSALPIVCLHMALCVRICTMPAASVAEALACH